MRERESYPSSGGYEANCLGTSHKRIKIVCIAGRCVADRPNAEGDDPEEQN